MKLREFWGRSLCVRRRIFSPNKLECCVVKCASYVLSCDSCRVLLKIRTSKEWQPRWTGVSSHRFSAEEGVFPYYYNRWSYILNWRARQKCLWVVVESEHITNMYLGYLIGRQLPRGKTITATMERNPYKWAFSGVEFDNPGGFGWIKMSRKI